MLLFKYNILAKVSHNVSLKYKECTVRKIKKIAIGLSV